VRDLVSTEKELSIEEQIRIIKEIMSKSDPVEKKKEQRKGLGKFKRCHRCRARLRWLSGYPYCRGCNWDYLTDPIYCDLTQTSKKTKKEMR
jgi:hypothetical protein